MPLFFSLLLLFLFQPPAGVSADTEILNPAKETTILSDRPNNGNGAGPFFFSGKIRTGGIRRALLAFDLSSIPSGSMIDNVSLSININRGHGSVQTSLHRLESDWGEGASSSTGGQGAAATSGDATWDNAFFNNIAWNSPGGDFVSQSSATATVGNSGSATWGGPGLVEDLQAWIDGAAENFGWILLGNESSNQTVTKFNATTNPPVLTIDFTPAGMGVPEDQTITFDPIPDKLTTDPPFAVTAKASSGLSVVFTVLSGPATLDGPTVTLPGEEGTVSIRASQAGDENFNPAPNVDQSFLVSAPLIMDPFEGFPLGEGFFFSDWYGIYNTRFYPWIYHVNHGWQFIFENASSIEGGVILFDLGAQDFWFTRKDFFIEGNGLTIFAFNRNTFIFYFDGSGDASLATPRDFSDFSTNEFFTIPPGTGG